MAEEVTVVPPAETTETGKEPESTTEDQHVPYERFKKANTQAKEAKDHAAKLERDLDDLRAPSRSARPPACRSSSASASAPSSLRSARPMPRSAPTRPRRPRRTPSVSGGSPAPRAP
jgi:hypothetical protein